MAVICVAATSTLATVSAAGATAPPGDPTGSSDAGPADSTAPSPPVLGGDSVWEKVVPGGGCECADGSEFAFWVREGNPSKVVFYLDGGGACVDATTSAFTGEGGENDFYDYNLATETPGLGGGIFDFDRG